jgi:hypothetical protein
LQYLSGRNTTFGKHQNAAPTISSRRLDAP